MNEQNQNNQLNSQTGSAGAPEINPSILGSVDVTQNNNVTEPQVTASPNPVGQSEVANLQAEQPTPVVEPTASVNVSQDPSGQMMQASTPQSPDTLQNVNTEPVAQPIPGTQGTPYQANSLTGNTIGVGTPSVGKDNLNSNGFVEPNKVENIGTIPPANSSNASEKNKKKPMNKVLFIILIIILIAAVAYGVYYFLNLSNRLEVTLKEYTVGVGETLSDNIEDYATINGSDADSCILNARNVNTSTLGEYEFSIMCGADVYTGTAHVVDNAAPEVVLNTIYRQVNSSVVVDDFIASCTDPSECNASFVSEDTINGYLQTAGGPYDVEINVADNANNSEVVIAQLYVTPYEIQFFRNCESPNTEEVNGYQATKTIADFMPMGSNGTEQVYLGVSQRIYTYVFTDQEEYNNVVGDKPSDLEFDGISGNASYNDEELTFQIATNLSIDTLNEDGVNYGVTTIPAFADAGQDSVSILSSSGLSMAADCENKEAAWEFIKYWTSAECNIERIGTELPVLNSVVESEGIMDQEEYAPFYTMLEQSEGHTPASFIIESWSETSESLELSFEQVFNPSSLQDVNEVLDGAAK